MIVFEKTTPLLCVRPLYVAKSPERPPNVRMVNMEPSVGLKLLVSEMLTLPLRVATPLTASWS